MNNQIVWGLPHVFAIFLIVAASGVLNVASIGSVFGKARLQGACAAVRPAVPRAARGRPRGADARSRPARTHDRRRDALQFHVGLRLERVPLHGHVRDRRRVPVDADGTTDGRVFRLRGARGLRLAHRAHHRHRHDLRLSRRPPGVRHRASAAAVHRDVVRVGPRGLPDRAGGALRLDRARRCRPTSSAACAGCSASSSPAFSTSRSSTTSPTPTSRSRSRSSGSSFSTAASTRRCSGGATWSPAASCRWSLIYHPRFGSTRIALCRVAARHCRRVRAALRVHHRRAGVAARDLPRPSKSTAASATARSPPMRRDCRNGCWAWVAWRLRFVITSVGVRVFPFMPEDDPVTMPAAEAAD